MISFRKRSRIQEGLFSLEEFVNVIKTEVHQEFDFSRGFYTCLIYEDDSFEITDRSFQRSIIYYGLDSPVPLLQVSLDYLVPSTVVKNIQNPTSEYITRHNLR